MQDRAGAAVDPLARSLPEPWPLVGREAELAVVERVIAEGRGIVLAGAPGVGKTRLAREAEAVATKQGAHLERVFATHSASSIPLAPLGHLDLEPDPDLGISPIVALRRRLAELAGQRRLVLVVDDAHALDDVSAALVHQLRATDEAAVVATVRARESMPDAVRALWKDDLCERIELLPLSRLEVTELLTRVLGGAVEAATAHSLWDASRGNVMYLRELVRGGLDSGALAQHGGLWAWHGPRKIAPRLVELLADRLDALDEHQREALELLALGEPLEWDALTTLAAPDAVEALLAGNLVETDDRGGTIVARLGHPLFGDVLRDALPAPRRTRLLRDLADEVQRRARGPEDHLLRVVTWRLDAGDRVDPAQLAAAAQACVYVDAQLTERLAREALDAGAGFPAISALAQLYQFTHRPAEAEVLLSSVDPAALTARERARQTVMRANNLIWGLGQPDDAVALLQDAARAAPTADASREFLAHLSPTLLFAGRLEEAVERGEQVVSERDWPAFLRLHAYLGLLFAFAARGKPETTLARVTEAMELVPLSTDELPVALGQLAACVTLSQQWIGQLDRAETVMRAAFEEGVARDVPLLRGGSALRLGQVALWRGRPETAAGFLRESIAALEQADAGLLAWAAHTLRMACALLGDLVGATQAQAVADRALRFPLYETERFRADAAVAAAAGDLAAAREIALDGIAWADTHGHVVPIAFLGWDLARYGDRRRAATTLEDIAPCIEGALTVLLARAARALADGDGHGLETASTELEELGYSLYAAETARAAARAHGAAGLRAREAAADARADRLAAVCERASTPLLADHGEAIPLTVREREVTGLAASGLHDAEIAERLGVSVRTVETHLHRAYAKLGITSRGELAGLFDG